jgi:hypothetical protein
MIAGVGQPLIKACIFCEEKNTEGFIGCFKGGKEQDPMLEVDPCKR